MQKDRSLLNEKKCSRSGNQGLVQRYYYERLIGDFSFKYCFGGQTFHGDIHILLRYTPISIKVASEKNDA